MALIFGLVVILTTSLVAHSQDKSGPLPPHLPTTLISQTPLENDTTTNSTETTDTYSSPEVISLLQTTADSASKSHPSPSSATDSTSLITSTPAVSFTPVPTDSTVTTTTSPLPTSPPPPPPTTTATAGSPSAETSKQTTSLTAATTFSSELFTESLTTTSPTFPPNMSSPTVEPATPTSTSQPSSTSVPPKQHHPGVSVALSLFILLAVILIIGAGVWWIRRRRQLERLRHQLMPMYNFDPTDDGDDWENQLLEEERSLRPEAEKVQLYSGNSTFDSGQKLNNSSKKE
ncbi:uncharacterized protein [Panulirus ornatus]|uniref:uncharacterized protein n=1 Tax=Panulirus ornatus TaxID=150431 RepID=UPI003A89B1DB